MKAARITTTSTAVAAAAYAILTGAAYCILVALLFGWTKMEDGAVHFVAVLAAAASASLCGLKAVRLLKSAFRAGHA